MDEPEHQSVIRRPSNNQQASLQQDAAQPPKHVLILRHFQLPTDCASHATWYNTATVRTRDVLSVEHVMSHGQRMERNMRRFIEIDGDECTRMIQI